MYPYLFAISLICTASFLRAQSLFSLEQLENDEEIPLYYSVDKAYIEKAKAYKLRLYKQANSLPPLVAQLPNLQALYAEHIYFEHLTEAIGDLEQLQLLSLRHNKVKELPEALAKLQNLRWLDLSKNRLISFPYPLG